MRGIVFAEFLEILEETFPIEVADAIVPRAGLPSGGVCATERTYDHHDFVTLAKELSSVTGIPTAEVLRTFGRHLFARFAAAHPPFFKRVRSTFELLRRIDEIHSDVSGLYRDADLPRIDVTCPQPGQAEMICRSPRPFADLAEGLIIACADHCGEEIVVERSDVAGDQGSVCFTLTSRAWATV